jgi:hypothetical protein
MPEHNQQQVEKRLSGLYNNPNLWPNFVEYLDYHIEQQHKVLEQSDSSVGIQRAQGYIQALKKLKALENIVKKD